MAVDLDDKKSDIEAIIADFLADSTQTSLELPEMTTAQRKLAKRIVETTPNLQSESYGFGQERRLHLFKQPPQGMFAAADTQQATRSVTVKNTFIDDWLGSDSGAAAEAPCFRSVPTGLSTNPLLSRIAENEQAVKPQELPLKLEHRWSDHSTAASSSGSATNSPRGSAREVLAKPPGLATPTGLAIRNTFIHFETTPTLDERIVQSMPHGMFGKALWADTLSEQVAENALISPTQQTPEKRPVMPIQFSTPSPERHAMVSGPPPPPINFGGEDQILDTGSLVSIVGLTKCPAFNGLSGKVQSFDTEHGRYSVLLTMPTGGTKVAKIKRENLQLNSPLPAPPAPPQFSPKFRAFRENAPASYVGVAVEKAEPKVRPPQKLHLTALV